MKIKSITIEGMHNVTKKTYQFNDITYLVGHNGAGKSTVLEAIQLALLGYIPGYAKTNEGIFRHASGRMMAVKLKLDDNGTEVVIDRSWLGGSSVKSETVISPDGYDITSIVKDIELPIFNFNEFKDMTANKLKEWFINFLPNAEGDIDWDKQLRDARPVEPLDTNLIASQLDRINKLSELYKGVQLLQELNKAMKEDESYYKAQSAAYRDTIDSLIYYDDVEEDVTEEDIQAKISDLYNTKAKLSEAANLTAMQAQIQSRIDAATRSKTDLPYVSEDDITNISATNAELEKQLSEIDVKIIEANEDLSNKKVEYSKQKSIVDGGSTCPFTGSECAAIGERVSVAKKAADKCMKAVEDAKAVLCDYRAEATELQMKSKECIRQISEIKNVIALHKQYEDVIRESTASLNEIQTKLAAIKTDDPMSVEQIDSSIAQYMDTLKKISANKKYNEMMNDVSAKKAVVDDSLDAMKAWVKLTGANGLQTQMMNGPFAALTDDMSKNLSAMFGQNIKAKFNLSEKANSFSFGLERDDSYIPFEVLSSGEKCLYTLALMLCIMDRSNTKLRLVIIDDLLDHLDGPNMKYTFESLSKLSKDTQIILAGVQPCGIKDIEVSVK